MNTRKDGLTWRRRGQFGGVYLAFVMAVALLGFAAPGGASASVGLCRTDPIVMLSNGVTMRLTTGVNDASSDVQSVLYTVALPAGVSINQVVYTGGALGGKESVVAQTANDGSAYNTTVLVTTGASNVQVAAGVALTSGQSGAAAGYSGQPFTVQVQ